MTYVGDAAEEDAQRSVTRRLVETLEWAGFAYQGAALAQTAVVDPFTPGARAVMLTLAGAHVVLAVLVRWAKGPFARGGPWIVAWLAGAFVVPAVVAVLSAPDAYASSAACVQACTYPAAPVLLVGFYPAVLVRAHRQGRDRVVLATGLLAALCVEWFALVYVTTGRFTWTTGRSALSAAIWVFMAYALGRVMGRLTRVVRRSQIELHRQNYEEFFDFLHSHVKSGLAAVRLEQPNVAGMLEKVQELEDTVSERRLEMLLSADRVPVAALCSERIRAFTGVLRVAESPRVGARTVPRAVGRLLDRTLGDLLKNAAVHGATTVRIRLTQGQLELVLEILDDGPGFPGSVLDDPATSLHRLRRSARDLGGDLTRADAPPRGSHLTLTVPEPARRRVGRGR